EVGEEQDDRPVRDGRTRRLRDHAGDERDAAVGGHERRVGEDVAARPRRCGQQDARAGDDGDEQEEDAQRARGAHRFAPRRLHRPTVTLQPPATGTAVDPVPVVSASIPTLTVAVPDLTPLNVMVATTPEPADPAVRVKRALIRPVSRPRLTPTGAPSSVSSGPGETSCASSTAGS